MPNNKDHKDNPVLGIAAGLGAFFMFAIMNILAKMLSDTHHVIEIAFYRNFVALIPFLVLIFIMGRRDLMKINKRPKTVIARSVLGAISLVVTFAAYAAMPMADTTAFIFTSSLLVPILGIIFLHEKVGVPRWLAIIIGFIGIAIMLNPSGNINMTGATIAMTAAMIHATLAIIVRVLGKSERPEVLTFYFFLIGFIVTAIPLPFVFQAPTLQEVPLLLGLGLSGIAAQLLIATAYKNAQPAIIAILNYSTIIWATLFGWLIWQDWPAQTIWLGGGLIIASNIFIIWRENRLKKKSSC